MASNNATEKGFQRAQKIDELRKKIGQTTESTELQKLHQQVAELVQFPDEFSSENEDPLQIQDKNEDMRNDDLPVIQSIPLLTSHSNGPTLSLFDPSAEECSSITSGEEFVRQTAKTRHRSGSSNSSASSLSAFGQKQPNQGRRRSTTPNKLTDPIRLTPDAKKRVMSYNYRGPLPSNHHCQRSLFGRTFEVTPPETPKRSKSSIGIIQKKTVPRSRSHSREKFAVTEVAKKGLTLHQLSCSADRHGHSHTQARTAAERSKSPVSRLSGNPTRHLKKFHQSNQGQNSLWQPFGRAKSMSMDGLSPGKLHENAFQVAQDEDGYAIPSTLNSSNSATPMAEEKTPHYSPFRKETSETPKHLYRTPMSEFRSGPLSDEEKFYTPSINFNRRPSMDVLEHEADSPVIKEIIRQKDERIARIDAALEKCMSPNEQILADFDEQINVNPCSHFREAPEVFEKNRQEAIESAVLLHQIASPRRAPQDPLQRWEDKREKIQSGHTLWNVETWQEIDFGSTEGADNFGDMQRQSEAQGETKKTDLQTFQRRTKVADAQTETDTAFGETKKTTQTTDAKKNTDFVPSRGNSDFGKTAKTTDKKSWNQFFVGHMRKEADFAHANVRETRKEKQDKKGGEEGKTGKDRSAKSLLFNFEKEPGGKKERKSGVANVKAQNEVPVSKFPQFMGTSLTPEKLKEIYCNSLDLFLTAKRKLIKFEKLKAEKLEDGRRLDEIERMLQDLEARREVAKLKVDNVLKDYNEVNGFYILGEIQKLQKATQSFVAILKDIKAGKRKSSGVFDRINVKAFENECLQHYNNRLEKAQKLNESIKRIDCEKSKAEKMEAKVVRKLVQMVTHNKSTEAVSHGGFSTETEVLDSESISSSKITYIKQFMAADYEKTKQLVSSRREKSDSISLSAAIPRMSLPASVLKSKFSSSSSALSSFNKSLDISGNANQEPFPLISARHHVERISEYMSKNPEPVRPQQEVVDEMNLFPFNPPPQLVPRLDFSSFREEQEADIDVSADLVQVNEAAVSAAGDVADDPKNKYRIEPLEEDSFVIESKSKDQEEGEDKLDSAGRTSRDVSSIDEVELDPVFDGRCQEENDEQVIDLTDRMEKISLLKEDEATERTQTPESDQVVSQKQVEEVVLTAKSSSESDSVFSALPSSSLSASQLQSLQEVASTASEEKEKSPVAVAQVEDVNEGAAKSSSESSVSAEVAAQDSKTTSEVSTATSASTTDVGTSVSESTTQVVSEPVIGKKDEDLTSVGEVTSEAESVPEMLVETGRDDTIASDLPSLKTDLDTSVLDSPRGVFSPEKSIGSSYLQGDTVDSDISTVKMNSPPKMPRRGSMSPLAAVSPRILNVSDHNRRSLSPILARSPTSSKSFFSKSLTHVPDLLSTNLDDLFVPYINDLDDSTAEPPCSPEAKLPAKDISEWSPGFTKELIAGLNQQETIPEAEVEEEEYSFNADGSNDLFNMKHRWNKLNAPNDDIFMAIRHESMYNYCKERDAKMTELAYQECVKFCSKHCPERLIDEQ